MRTFPLNFTLCLIGIFLYLTGSGQPQSNQAIKNQIEAYKKDPRGPYKYLRWFCFDGRVNPPKEPCGDDQGVQRAAYKDEVEQLAATNHVFLGQILANTPKADFWDASHYQSRLKQYQIEKFLKASDDGWVLRRAQYYRGAFQAEDELAWGSHFFQWLLLDETNIDQHFFLIRQAAKDIPHGEDSDKTQEMRAISKTIAEEVPTFMDLRVKIHGQPESKDIQSVQQFLQERQSQLSSDQKQQIDELLDVMREVYRPMPFTKLKDYVASISATSSLRQSVEAYLEAYANQPPTIDRIGATAALLLNIRAEIVEVTSANATARLDLIDLSNKLEGIIKRDIADYPPTDIRELMELTRFQAMAAAGCGFLELWEWNQIMPHLEVPSTEVIEVEALNSFRQSAGRVIEWGAGMVKANYGDVVQVFTGFEPMAAGFIDDRIRSSILLPLGESVGQIGTLSSDQVGLSNQVFNLSNQATIRGVNPGYAKGELVVVTGHPGDLEVSKDKIYVLEHPPADMKPVAGMLTVSEGNLVSHLQLLARNLGIPNAVLSNENVAQLKAYSGQEIFYAVSPGGRVLLKEAYKMTSEESALFSEENKQRNDQRINVPVERINLTQQQILNLRNVKADDSGVLCGPKAANLGQLKILFPNEVVEGFVIPFGIFRAHLDQIMPGTSKSYWNFLNDAFRTSNQMEKDGQPASDVENYTLQQLEILRQAILNMPFLPGFQADLESSFQAILGQAMGRVPVFLRSDTNMEDLKEFTGAGLNLTLFNVRERNAIIEGIKKVWASPYTERSFKWRQRYLLNPENVFPSILVIPGVNNDCSGVLITKGVSSGKEDDLTVAFSRGVGGAVEGQVAETWLLETQERNTLLSPAREEAYTVLLDQGGVTKQHATFEQRILDENKLMAIRDFVPELLSKLPTAPGIDTDGPFDVELGFKSNKLYLFQARPYVESKTAGTSTYLLELDPPSRGDQNIFLSRKL